MHRLSSPEPGKNHAVVPSEFMNWWGAVLSAQGDEVPILNAEIMSSKLAPPSEDKDQSSPNRLVEMRPLTIPEAKISLAQTFGVSPDKIKIIIRG